MIDGAEPELVDELARAITSSEVKGDWLSWYRNQLPPGGGPLVRQVRVNLEAVIPGEDTETLGAVRRQRSRLLKALVEKLAPLGWTETVAESRPCVFTNWSDAERERYREEARAEEARWEAEQLRLMGSPLGRLVLMAAATSRRRR
jgi:hypothetical protein